MRRSVRLRRVVVVAALIATGAACSSNGAAYVDSAERPPATIPLPSPDVTYQKPDLPKAASMPPNTTPLEELHRQGKTDVLR
ncbi:MAG TPA: hypothetical protein VHF27_04575 [Acidimicrobiales bacterium]|nr:hypothetical protein [Acidimicrobiales bacterium]